MTLTTKIIAATIGSITVCVAVGLVVQRGVIRDQGIELTRNTMRAAVLEAENVRESISSLNKRSAFDMKQLLDAYHKEGDLRNSTLYRTIPVVAAWEAVARVAEKEGYEFRIPKHQARNPKNNPLPEEEEILAAFEKGGLEEYFKVDRTRNEIVFARPITLTADCLTCHGDPKHSPTGDGKDLVGFPMEGWKVGETHGAFVLKSKLDRVDRVVTAGMNSTLVWVVPGGLLIALAFYLLNRVFIVRPLNTALESIDQTSDQVAAASRETAAKIEDSVTKSQQGAEISGRVARSFEGIQRNVQELDLLVAEISNASQEQSQGINQVTIAVAQMDRVTQSNAASSEESASASEELSAQARNLKGAVQTVQELFMGRVGSGNQEPAAADPTHVVAPSPVPSRTAPPSRSQSPAHPSGAKKAHASGGFVLHRNGMDHPFPASNPPSRPAQVSSSRGEFIPMPDDKDSGHA